MRINKYISETGYCSRRETDRLIEAGRITVNDVICEPGTNVELGDLVLIDGKTIPLKEKPVYTALHKPVGITCTAAKQAEGNIIQFIKYPSRIFPIGRLDKDSEGLILLTNDGEIVNKMMRSENGHEKEYVVTVDKPITKEFINKMSSGVEIMGTVTKPCQTFQTDEFEYRIILTQGLNRQIRRMSKELGYRVLRLIRTRIMNIQLTGLEIGKWRDLTTEEMEKLLSTLK